MDVNEVLANIPNEDVRQAVKTLAEGGIDTLGVDVQKAMVDALHAAKAADLLEQLRQETHFKAVRKSARKALEGLRAFGIVPGGPRKAAAKQVQDLLNRPNTAALKPSDKLGRFRVLFNVPEKGGAGPEIPMIEFKGDRVVAVSLFEASAQNARRINDYLKEDSASPIADLPYEVAARFVLDSIGRSPAGASDQFSIEHAAHLTAVFKPFKDQPLLAEWFDGQLAEIKPDGEETLANWEVSIPDPAVRVDMQKAVEDALNAVTAVDDAQRESLAIQGVMGHVKTFLKAYAGMMDLYFRVAAYCESKAGNQANAAALLDLARAMADVDALNPGDYSLFKGLAKRLVDQVKERIAAEKEAQADIEGEQDANKD